jgi:hypothetical protein
MQGNLFEGAEMIYWYKRDPNAMLTEIRGLSRDAKAAFNIILDLLYARDGDLPDDEHLLCAQIECRRDWWRRVRGELITAGKLWVLPNGSLMAPGVEEALKEAGRLSEAQSARAKKRWNSEENREKSGKTQEKSELSRDNSDLAEQKLNKNNGHLMPITPHHTTSHHTDARSARLSEEGEFEEFWKVYPKREGPNPRKPAFLAFERALRRGVSAAEIVEGGRRYAGSAPAERRFIPQAVTWLNQERWKDNTPAPATTIPQIGFHADFGSAELEAWDAYGRATKGVDYPRDKRGGWTFPTQWPPNFAAQEAVEPRMEQQDRVPSTRGA